MQSFFLYCHKECPDLYPIDTNGNFDVSHTHSSTCAVLEKLKNTVRREGNGWDIPKFLDLELAMPPGAKATKRMETYKGNNEKFTHRIRLAAAKDVDKDVKAALKVASDYIRTK